MLGSFTDAASFNSLPSYDEKALRGQWYLTNANVVMET